MTDLPLTKISETDDKLVLGHDPVPGAIGFRISPVVKGGQVQQGKWSHTWDGSRTRHTFAAGFPPYRVEALTVSAAGSWTGEEPPPPPPPTGKQPAFRTNYAALNLGSNLDPLWWYNGSPSGAKHTGPGATIEIVDDPLGQKGHVQRHVVQSGSVLFGGDRCEVLTSKIGGGFGARFQFRFDLMLPAGFKSGTGWDTSLLDYHYPNNGPAQSPITFYVRNGGELWARVLGGPLNSDGTMGSIRHEAKLATLTKGVWNQLGFDVYQHDIDGLCDAFVNGQKMTTWGEIPTSTKGVPNSTYLKLGFYRPPNSPSGTQTMYFTDTLCWFESSPAAMLGWAS